MAMHGHEQMSSNERLFTAGLSLFGLSIALSKSASNVLIGLMYLAVVLLLVARPLFREQVRRALQQPVLMPFMLFLGVAVIGLVNTGNMHDGLGIVSKLTGLALIYVMVSVLLDAFGGHSAPERVLLSFLIGITVLDLIAVLTYLGIVGDRKFFLPLWPGHVHHIWFSNLNAVGIYTALGFLLFGPRKFLQRDKLFFTLFLGLAAFCVLLSLSRTAWTGLLVTSFVLVSLFIRKKRNIAFVLAALLAGVVLSYAFSSIVQMRLDMIVSDIAGFQGGNTNTNIGARFLLWKAAFGMFLSNPVLGVGTGDFVQVLRGEINAGYLPSFLQEFNQPHNMYLFAMATNGVLGLAALLYLLYRILVLVVPLLRAEPENAFFAYLAAATTVHYLAAGMTDSLFNIQMLRYVFGFVIGVCVRRSMVLGKQCLVEEGNKVG